MVHIIIMRKKWCKFLFSLEVQFECLLRGIVKKETNKQYLYGSNIFFLVIYFGN